VIRPTRPLRRGCGIKAFAKIIRDRSDRSDAIDALKPVGQLLGR